VWFWDLGVLSPPAVMMMDVEGLLMGDGEWDRGRYDLELRGWSVGFVGMVLPGVM
jgi:hypothetical protein